MQPKNKGPAIYRISIGTNQHTALPWLFARMLGVDRSSATKRYESETEFDGLEMFEWGEFVRFIAAARPTKRIINPYIRTGVSSLAAPLPRQETMALAYQLKMKYRITKKLRSERNVTTTAKGIKSTYTPS